MTSTTNKVYVQPTVGGDTGVWGTELNTDLGQIDQNLGSNLAVSITSADVTLTTGASGQYQNFSYTLSGTLTGNHQLIVPALGGFYQILNNCTGGFTITVIVSGGTGVTVAQGTTTLVWSDGTNVYYADSYSYNGIGSYGGLVNKFRNGTMDTFSRGASSTVTTSGAYTADGWIVLPTGASVAVASSTARSLTVNSLQVTGATSVTDVIIKQRIESFMCAPLSGQTVTVQAQVFNNTGGSITPTLTVRHPTATDNYTSTTTDVSAATLQTCTNSAWTQISYTFTAASQVFGLEVSFDFGNNFSTSGKSIKITECDIRVTPGVATSRINPNPPPPELRPIGAEMPLNQRYYWTSLPGVVPGNGSQQAQTMTAGSTAGQQGAFLFPVPMRAAPTITSYSTSTGISGKAFNVSAASDISVTPAGITNMAVTLPFNGASPALITPDTYTWYTTASAEI